METPIHIQSEGVVYPYIVFSSYQNTNGSYYLKDKDVIINGQSVNVEPSIMNDNYVYEGEKYQLFTLAGNSVTEDGKNAIPHRLTATKDCELNFILIGTGAPGATSGNSTNRSNGPGGNAGSVVSGKIKMKAFDSLAVSCYANSGTGSTTDRVAVDTLEWMGKEKDPLVIRGNIRTYDNTNTVVVPFDSQIKGVADGVTVNVVAGGAYWPVSSKDTDLYIKSSKFSSPAGPCTVIGLGNDISNYQTSSKTSVYSDNWIIWPAREGGCAYYEKRSTTSFGLASGIYDQNVSGPVYCSLSILDKVYWLPFGGGAGGGDSGNYSVNYNTTVIPAQIASKSLGGSGMLGGGFGNIINNEGKPRTLDAWMPGAGGGGAFQGNINGEFTNGYGGQGVMICWIKH